MAISRFDKRQGVQFNPMDFSTMAAAPIAMQQRYDQTQDKMGTEFDKMATIENTGDELADATVQQHKDNLAAYADRLSQEGYSPGMTDEFMQIKRGYTGDLNSIAGWREAASKQSAFEQQQDAVGSNIKVGQSNLGYDSYKQDPTSFGQGVKYFNADEFYKAGAGLGSSLSKIMDDPDYDKANVPAGYIRAHEQAKFGDTKALMNYIESDEGSEMVSSLVSSRYGDSPDMVNNPRIRAAVTQGILSTGIGSDKSQMLLDKEFVGPMSAYQRAQMNKKALASKGKATTPYDFSLFTSSSIPLRSQSDFEKFKDVKKILKDGSDIEKKLAGDIINNAVSNYGITIPEGLSDIIQDSPDTDLYSNTNDQLKEYTDAASAMEVALTKTVQNMTLAERKASEDELRALKNKRNEISQFKDVIVDNAKLYLDSENFDLALPVHQINPFSEEGKKTNDIIKNSLGEMLHPDNFEFVMGDFADIKDKKLADNKDYETLAKGDNMQFVGISADSNLGVHYVLEDKSTGKRHIVKPKNDRLHDVMLEAFNTPEYANVEAMKDFKLSHDALVNPKTDEAIEFDFKVNKNKVNTNGSVKTEYEVPSVTVAEYYGKLFDYNLNKELSNLEQTYPGISSNPRVRKGLEDDIYRSMSQSGIDINSRSPYKTSNKHDLVLLKEIYSK